MLKKILSRLHLVLKSWLDFNFHNYKKWATRIEIDSINGYLINRNAESNLFLSQILDNLKWNVLVEIGSNCGNRIIEIAKRNPTKILYGIDLNRPSVQIGNLVASKESIANIEFFPVDIRSPEFRTFLVHKSPDCLISWATLITIHPFYIEEIFRTINNSSLKTLILIEQHDSLMNTIFTYRGVISKGSGNWKRNYEKIIRKVSNDSWQIDFIEVPLTVWSPGGGYGNALIARKKT